MKRTQDFFRTEAIILRKTGPRDYDALARLADNANSINQWYVDAILPPDDPQALRAQLDELAKNKTDNQRYTILLARSGEYAGEIEMWDCEPRNGHFRFGIYVADAAKGAGVAREAILIMLDYYFNELNYQKCTNYIYDFNARSRRFHEKLGFIKEGEIRRAYYSRGEYHNSVYYGITREEFNALHGGELAWPPQNTNESGENNAMKGN